MSVAAGGGAAKIDKTKLMMYGLGGGVLGIYLAHVLNEVTGTDYFSFLAGLGVIAAVVMGSDAVRRVCSYGIGTGVPSIGLMAMGMGLVAAMFGLSIGGVAGPIIGIAVSMGFGYVVGLLTNKIIKMNIPVLEETLMTLGAAGAIVLIGLGVMISGEIDYRVIIGNVIDTGYIAIVFIIGSLAILHPFNANLGPDETQDRTLVHSVSAGALAMFAVGIASLETIGVEGFVSIFVAAVVWIVFFKKFFDLVKRDSAGVKGTGLLPEGGM